ncbi:Protein FAM63B [Acipenser ruthenus]|uniref:Ubiquitin carboxyl-terminal hydrolase n=1 Tax=Acipenser ruthenus TaxID=7906 RepID=A0A444UW67_ACIRT|nr:Protein FAM63B [Acipenser ruthenus]
MSDAMAVLHKLQTGLDVNVKFTGVRVFEYTPECIVFDLLDIPLYHGWLVDPQINDIVKAVGNCSYNQLVEKIIISKQSNRSELVGEGYVAEQFLNSTATQLTYHGLCELTSTVQEGELCVFFRNNHFSTMTKYKGQLYLLVTDQGFLTEEKVVWESLHNVDGDGNFCDSEFHLRPPSGPETDYMMALSLQQEQQSQDLNWEQLPEGVSDLELAKKLQEEEDRRASQFYQEQEQAAAAQAQAQDYMMALSLQQEQQSQDLNWEQLPEGVSDLELAKKLQEEEDRRASQFYQEQEQAAEAQAQAQCTALCAVGLVHRDYILDAKPKEISEIQRLNYEQNMSDAMAVLHKLQTGLDVNVKFTGVRVFEYTPECIVFDLLDIPLYHGWLVDPQINDIVKAVGNCSYNQLVEKIIISKQSNRSELVGEGYVAEQFLNSTATQLTYHGLCELTSTVQEGELCVFFRNNHFSTMTKYKDLPELTKFKWVVRTSVHTLETTAKERAQRTLGLFEL